MQSCENGNANASEMAMEIKRKGGNGCDASSTGTLTSLHSSLLPALPPLLCRCHVPCSIAMRFHSCSSPRAFVILLPCIPVLVHFHALPFLFTATCFCHSIAFCHYIAFCHTIAFCNSVAFCRPFAFCHSISIPLPCASVIPLPSVLPLPCAHSIAMRSNSCSLPYAFVIPLPCAPVLVVILPCAHSIARRPYPSSRSLAKLLCYHSLCYAGIADRGQQWLQPFQRW